MINSTTKKYWKDKTPSIEAVRLTKIENLEE